MKPAIFVFAIAAGCSAQSVKASATVTGDHPCVIVKRHVHKIGENMTRFHAHRPFDYVEGEYPAGYTWRSELGDGDVRDLQDKGGKIVVMRTDYQLADLEDARKQCQSQVMK